MLIVLRENYLVTLQDINTTPKDTWYDAILWVLGVLGQG